MQSNLPSSFASAAAGQNSNRENRSGSGTDGRGNSSGEWSRTGRSTNGTRTFRRPSTTPSSQSLSQMSAADPVQPPATTSEPVPQRYTREQLLSIFDSSPQTDVTTLFVPGWNPGHVNGSNAATRGWGQSNESRVQPQEPDLCWDTSASTRASNLREMTTEEKDLFSTDVNSTVKPPLQNKDGGHTGGGLLNGRKTSVSHGTPNNFSLASPSSATRPGTRRRETADTNPFPNSGLASPTVSTRPGREDGSSWLNRKNTDAKDPMFEDPEEDTSQRENPVNKGSALPFAGVLRNNTASGSPGIGTSSSLWGQPAPQAASTSSIGSFGNFALPSTSAVGEKRPGNGQSRLAHLMPKDSNDSIASRPNEASSAVDPGRSWRSRPRTDTDPFGGDDSLSGSAVLGGAQDTSPPPLPNESRRNLLFDTPVKGSAGDFGMSGLNLGSQPEQDQEHAPLSPSETNPYQSPPGERGEADEGAAHGQGLGLGGLGGSEHVSAFGGGLPRAFGHAGFDGSDRSQTSSAGAKGYPSLTGLGGWPTSATPDRERNLFGGGAFGNSLFGPMGDLHSPGLGNLGGVFGPAGSALLPGSGSMGRGSKLGSLFPAAMQAQMQGHDNDSLADSLPDLRQANPLGAIGRNTFGGDQPRELESPLRAGRGGFPDIFASDASRAPVTSESLSGGVPALAQPQAFPQSSGAPFGGTQPSEPHSAQARSMVMPDRMRWVYLDPQGLQQGPFTGLDMNDWYKANFFTADLRVKKLEDSEFEPLGQLIRRIGNSREPFLVPMMGIPHGPPSQTGPFSPNAGGVVQPPLVGAFPSFGRTLTAQEQNDLERRKQEDQFLQAQQQQRDNMVSSQQRFPRVQMQGHPGLQHHSSAHSLQSQPSFGSMSSPITMPPQQPIGPIGGIAPFFGAHPQHQPIGHGNTVPSIGDLFREEELARMSSEERQTLAHLQGPGAIGTSQPQQQVGGPSMESFRNRLPTTRELLEDEEGFRGRLQEFEQLRAQHDAQTASARATQESKFAEDSSSLSHAGPRSEAEASANDNSRQLKGDGHNAQGAESAALNKHYEQAQAAAAAKLSGLPMPFPPPQTSTPLPAPAPQRVRSNLPAQYANSSRSETPEITPSSAATQPPPLAPWAKDVGSESHRGPSLKEIQEAEAKKTAKADELAASTRRAMAEQEAARERERVANIASGLPTTSTWGTASPVTAGSPWTKPTAAKGPAPGLATPVQGSDKKKTLADIQREEESRKAKARELAAQSGVAASAGKRYADLASKPNAIPGPGAGTPSPVAGWATVGAGGKVKVPTGPASQSRTVSSTNIKIAAAPVAAKTVAKPVSVNNGSARNEAMDEFNKWLQGQLTRGITGVNDINNFAQTLMVLPLEPTIIADAVYANSKTMNGQHFAAEFIRRKKLAEKGVVEKQATDVPAQSGAGSGWNEVAKKTAHKEGNGESVPIPAGFKVVPGRKKSKK